MHLGEFLRNVLNKNRYSLGEVASMVNKSLSGVKKDLEKEKLAMPVLESYAKALHINLYELLALEWAESHGTGTLTTQEKNIASEPEREPYEVKKSINEENAVSVTLTLTGEKKDEILKILLNKK